MKSKKIPESIRIYRIFDILASISFRKSFICQNSFKIFDSSERMRLTKKRYIISLSYICQAQKEVSSHRESIAFKLQTPRWTSRRRVWEGDRNPNLRSCRDRENKYLYPACSGMCKAGAEGNLHWYRRTLSCSFQADSRGKRKRNS